MNKIILLALLFCSGIYSYSQGIKFGDPVKLGAEVNTSDEELAPILSPDGHTLYFSRAFHAKNMGGKYAGTDIWISRKDDAGKWTTAVNAGRTWNNKRSNAVIGISKDGKTVYLLNAYNNKSGIASSKYVNGKWTKPEVIQVPGINKDDFIGVYVHPDYDVMIISMKGSDSYGEEDLYVSLRDSSGNWNRPMNLGSSINTNGFEIAPFLSDDKTQLFFSSNGHKGFGESDLFLSEREYGVWNLWSYPQNLGSSINTDGFESYLSMHNDTIAFFPRNLNTGHSDIFESHRIFMDEILPGNSKFLTDEELDKIFPKRVSMNLHFKMESTKITEDQKEVIWFLANKIIGLEDVNVLLLSKEEENPLVSGQRFKEIVGVFKLAGLEESRILTHTLAKRKVANTENRTIEIILFR